MPKNTWTPNLRLLLQAGVLLASCGFQDLPDSSAPLPPQSMVFFCPTDCNLPTWLRKFFVLLCPCHGSVSLHISLSLNCTSPHHTISNSILLVNLHSRPSLYITCSKMVPLTLFLLFQCTHSSVHIPFISFSSCLVTIWVHVCMALLLEQ